VFHCNQVCVSSRCRDIGPQTYWGHNLHHSESRDVIGHVTIRLAIGHFLLVVICNRASISIGFRDIRPQTCTAHRHNAESSLCMHDSTWHVLLCKISVRIL